MTASNGSKHATLTEALRALRARGVGEHVFADFRTIDPAVILDTCSWFDEQNGRVGTGVLVEELRGGGRKPARTPRRPRSADDEQREYLDGIVAWLREHLPELVDDGPSRLPHPAAITAVIRLHWRHGKASLSAQEHGERIRAAVRNFGTGTPSEAAQPSRSRRHAPTPGAGTSQGRRSAAPPDLADQMGGSR